MMSGKSVVTVVDKRTIHTDALDILGRIITDDDKVGRDAIHLAVEPVVAGERVYPGQDVGRLADGTFGIKGVNKTLGIVDPFITGPIQPGQKFFLVVYPRQITTLRHVWEHPEFPSENPPASVLVADPKDDKPKFYHLILTESGKNKIQTMKTVREVAALGLHEAKLIVENTPCFIHENIDLGWATTWAKKFDGIAKVEIVEVKPDAGPINHALEVSWEVPWETGKIKEAIKWITIFAGNLKKDESWGDDVLGHTYDEIMTSADAYLSTGEHSFVSNSDIYDQDWKTFWEKFKIITGKEPEAGDVGGFFSCSC